MNSASDAGADCWQDMTRLAQSVTCIEDNTTSSTTYMYT